MGPEGAHDVDARRARVRRMGGAAHGHAGPLAQGRRRFARHQPPGGVLPSAFDRRIAAIGARGYRADALGGSAANDERGTLPRTPGSRRAHRAALQRSVGVGSPEYRRNNPALLFPRTHRPRPLAGDSARAASRHISRILGRQLEPHMPTLRLFPLRAWLKQLTQSGPQSARRRPTDVRRKIVFGGFLDPLKAPELA